jgi:hypothetical protein
LTSALKVPGGDIVNASTNKIKKGYSYVIEDASLPAEAAPSHVYNVPNPPSDVAPDVTKEQVREAIAVHRKTVSDQLDELKVLTKRK